MLYKTYEIYSKKKYKNYNKIIENNETKICKMLDFFKNEYCFIFHIKRFEAFYNNSLWNFKIINIGKSAVYNLSIEFDNSLTKNSILSKDLIKFNECVELNIVYFDFGIRINSFDFGYSKYTNTEFYLIKESRYNNKDEIIFKLSYINDKGKIKIFYFCSRKVDKNTYKNKKKQIIVICYI